MLINNNKFLTNGEEWNSDPKLFGLNWDAKTSLIKEYFITLKHKVGPLGVLVNLKLVPLSVRVNIKNCVTPNWPATATKSFNRFVLRS